MIIFRDDDIEKPTCFDLFRRADAILRERAVTHTIAVIADKIDLNPDVCDYINSPRRRDGFDVQLHCWNHDHPLTSYTATNLEHDLGRGKAKLENLFGKPVSVLYPPWNKSSPTVIEAASRVGLAVSFEKISLSQYLRAGGDVGNAVINFHYWSDEVNLLAAAVEIYANRRDSK